ncbi:GNAT family N-acetyltransferase [Piscirickettsia litoralis]|uniref:N-acetyltransferase domain-containing protein n=1 Tax=Piscirickettsia litoralis TaxID=1891921 RepID=A0ABX3A113_9GAMM|nr:GNAT family N-acetyltransferase [Piscirickettsia litoralis]ODN41318.1 hypothetical protein BGC07_17300 [Piscirickettsia litoralis]
MTITIERLNPKKHNRNDFNCGEPEINTFLKRYATQAQKTKTGDTFCAIDSTNPSTILGYYSISPINADVFQNIKGLPKRPNHCLLIGKLAVDLNFQDQGLGKFLIHHAFKTAIFGMPSIFCAVIVDLKNTSKQLTSFYSKLGFYELTEKRWFIPMKEIEKIFRLMSDRPVYNGLIHYNLLQL